MRNAGLPGGSGGGEAPAGSGVSTHAPLWPHLQHAVDVAPGGFWNQESGTTHIGPTFNLSHAAMATARCSTDQHMFDARFFYSSMS